MRWPFTAGMKMLPKLLPGVLVLGFYIQEMPLLAATESPDQQLIEAAGRGNLHDVRAALSAGAKINSPSGPTALFAILDSFGLDRESAERIIMELLKQGADINAPGPKGISAFQEIMTVGATSYPDMIPLFAEDKPDLNFRGNSGGVISLALQLRCFPPLGFKPLKDADCPDGLLPALTFVELGAPVDVPDKNGVTPLMTIVDEALGSDSLTHPYYPDFARLLLAKGADPMRKDKQGRNAMDHAIAAGNYEMLLLLDVHREYHGEYEKVRKRDWEERLSKAARSVMWPVPPSKQGEPVGDEVDGVDLVREALQAGADPNALSLGYPITIFEQSLMGDGEPIPSNANLIVVQLLLEHGADVNRRLPDGKLPLEIVFDKPGLYALLTAHGAKPDEAMQRTLATRPSEIDDIREAIFRHQMGSEVDVPHQLPIRIFLAMFDRTSGKYVDPSPAFMKRFADRKFPPAGQSGCIISGSHGVKDKVTGEVGEVFSVGPIKRVSANEVEADGSWYASGVGASSNTYHLQKKSGKWVVVKDVMNTIS